MTYKYYTAVETARLIRKQLKKNFPGIKFSVRTDRSISISWTDGPSDKEVENVTSAFSGARFDGMIDLEYHTTSWLLPDGSVQIADSGSNGITEATKSDKPHKDAIEVRFGASYIFLKREYSVEALTLVSNDIAKYWGFETIPTVEDSNWNGARITSNQIFQNSNNRLSSEIYSELSNINLSNLDEYQPKHKEIEPAEFDIEIEEVEEITPDSTDIEIEEINPLVHTAKVLLSTMNYGDVLNTLIGGGLDVNAALEVLQQV